MFGRDKQANANPQPAANAPYTAPAGSAAQRTSAPTAKMETIIGPNCQMSGVLKSDGGVRVEGVFEGQIQTAGNLVIAESAKVIADIQAFNMVVSGSVKGNVTANKLEITESGKVWGDLNINSLLLAEGGYLRGSTNMTGDVEPPVFDSPKIAPPKPVVAELESPKG